jgi:putative spermidine/putrescine transport system substrate-binding protein
MAETHCPAARLSRRALGAAVLGAAVAAPALSRGAAAVPAKPDSLTLNVYSGPFEDNMRKFVAIPFQRETGIKVELIASSPPLAKLQAEGDDPELDVLLGGEVERLISEKQGFIVDLDPALIPALSDVYDIARKRNGVVLNFSALGLAYDTTQWPAPPTSWFDLVSPTTPGKIVVRAPDAQNTVAWMAILARSLNGAWPTKPDQYDKVCELITANLKPRLSALATNTADTRAAFTRAHVALAVWTDSQVATFLQEVNLPLGFVTPKEGAVMIPTTAMVTRTRNGYWAQRLIAAMLAPDAQRGFAANGFYAPSNRTVVLDKALGDKMAYGPDKIAQLLDFPWDKLIPINQRLVQRFTEAIS